MPLFLKDKKILKTLGQGACGKVHLIEEGGEFRALKVLRIDPLRLVSLEEALSYAHAHSIDEEEASRILIERRKSLLLAGFKYEAQTLKKLTHQNITQFYDYGYAEKEDRYFMVSEYIDGINLFNATEDLPFSKSESLFVAVLRGINYLHYQKVYHFDLKDENILVTKEKNQLVPKILDFGLANFHMRPEYASTESGGVGTPLYIAPEVWLGGKLNQQTDLYSLGILFYKCLTRVAPFDGKTQDEIKQQHLHALPKPPSRINLKVPLYWDRIIARLTEKNPQDRYPDAGFVIQEIRYLSKGKYEVETSETQMSYLPATGKMVGRDEELQKFCHLAEEIFSKNNLETFRFFIIKGNKGCGKSRLLDEIKFIAKLNYNLTIREVSDLESPITTPSLIALDEDQNVSRDELNSFLLQNYDKPVLIVTVEKDQEHEWLLSEEVFLNHFSKEQVADYLKPIVRSDEIPQFVIDHFYNQTNGNPFLLTELTRLLIKKNYLVDSQGVWSRSLLEDIALREDKSSLDFCSEEILLDTLNKANLTSAQESLLHCLSVWKRPVTLEELSLSSGENEVASLLYPLIKAEILKEGPADYFTFSIGSFEALIAKKLPDEKMREVHLKIAKALEKLKADEQEIEWHRACLKQNFSEMGTSFTDLAKLYESEGNFKRAIACYEYVLEHHDAKESYLGFSLSEKLINALFHDGQYMRANKLGQLLIDRLLKISQPSGINQPQSGVEGEAPAALPMEGALPAPTIDELLWRVNDICLKISISDRDFLTSNKYLNFVSEKLSDFIHQDQNRAQLIFWKNRKAQVCLMNGQVREAEEIFKNTLKEEASLPPEEKDKVTNNDLDEIYFLQKKYEDAIQICEAKLKETTSPVQMSRCLFLLGKIFIQSGDMEKAILNLEQCIKVSKEHQYFPALIRAYNSMGNIFEQKQDFAQVMDYYKRALALAQKWSDTVSCGTIAWNMGRIYNLQKDSHNAYPYLIYALRCFHELKKISPMSLAHFVSAKIELAETLSRLGELDKSEHKLEEAKALIDEHKNLSYLNFWLYAQYAYLCHFKKDENQTQHYFEKAKELAQSKDEKKVLSEIGGLLSQLDSKRP